MDKVRDILRRKPVVSYFTLTYILSWLFLIPGFMALLNAGWDQDGLDTIPPLALIGLIGTFGPSIAAIILTRTTEGKSKTWQLIKKLIIWRVHIKWYLFVLFVPAILLSVSALISRLFGFSLGQAIFTNFPVVVITSILMTIPFGPLPEELGWRGYALPKLLEKYNPITASLIVGFFWAFWHIPAFFVPGVAIPSVFEVNALTILLYLLNNTALSLIFTAVYLRTKGSVLIAILLHAGSNASANIVYYVLPQIESVASHRMIIFSVNIILMAVLGLAMLRKQKAIL
jgi:membrane protease YdiL (CAAX protease family)